MENDSAASRILRFLWVVALSLVAFAQSRDEVHIVPKDIPEADKANSYKGLTDLKNDPLLRVDVNLVLVPVVVSDSMNRPVTTLKKQDFALYDENKQQEIRYFSAEEAPVSVAILLDVSKSMASKIDTERAAIVEFFNNANPNDEYFAIAFSDRPRVLASFSRSVDDIERKLLGINPGGPTAMLDAIYLAVSKLRSAHYQRKAIVIISDGGDNASRYTMRDIKRLVQESDVQIYAIGLFDTFFVNAFEARMGKKWLSEITDTTGGRTITVDNRAKLPDAAAEISRQMRSQYLLGYRPSERSSSKWRKIKVHIKSFADERLLRAYYRQGYSPTY